MPKVKKKFLDARGKRDPEHRAGPRAADEGTCGDARRTPYDGPYRKHLLRRTENDDSEMDYSEEEGSQRESSGGEEDGKHFQTILNEVEVKIEPVGSPTEPDSVPETPVETNCWEAPPEPEFVAVNVKVEPEDEEPDKLGEQSHDSFRDSGSEECNKGEGEGEGEGKGWFSSDDEDSDMGLSDSDESDGSAKTGDSEARPALAPTAPITPIVWGPDPPRPRTPKIPFTRPSGLKEHPSGSEPVDYFHLIANDKFYDIVLTATNDYGKTLKLKDRKTASKLQQWKPITKTEFDIFIGLLFHMGSIKLMKIQDYWRKIFLLDIPVFRQCMSRNRFILILSCLRFTAFDTDRDKYRKVRPVVDFFNERMDAVYAPGRVLSVDSTMGGKISMLVEPYGVIQRVEYTTGKDPPTHVVRKLLKGRLGAGHSLYLNTVYNSVHLGAHLLDNKTYCTGPLRHIKNANLPSHTVNKKLQKGQETHRYSKNGVCVLKWRDRRELVMLSSELDASMELTVGRNNGRTKLKPKILKEYNKVTLGVDQSEQIKAFYPFIGTNMKWWKAVSIHTFQIILLNAYHLYSKGIPGNKGRMDYYEFRLKVIDSLLGNPKPAGSAPPIPVTQIQSVHLPSCTIRNSSTKRKMRKRCVICSKTGRRRESIYLCALCPEQPGLCLDPCFRMHHNYM